jgi:hypothetical protein
MVYLTFALLAAALPAWGQTRNSLCDEIAKLKSGAHGYMGPARWQDEELTFVDQQILRLRVKAIPSLIACLTDERRTEVYGQLWGEPSVGMVAFSMLWDMFTACEEGEGVGCRYTVKGVVTWNDICAEGPADVVYPCWAGWDEHLKKYGWQSIQQSWQKAWTENKERIYWDEPGKCFRLRKTP